MIYWSNQKAKQIWSEFLFAHFNYENVQNISTEVVTIIKYTCTAFIDNFRNMSTNSSI